MSSTQSYGVDLTTDYNVAICLDTGRERAWRVDSVKFLTDTGASAKGIKAGLRQGRVLQVLDNKDISLLVTSLPTMKAGRRRAALTGIVNRDKGDRKSEWVIADKVLPARSDIVQKSGQQDIAAMCIAAEQARQIYAESIALNIRPRAMTPAFQLLGQLFRQAGPCPPQGEAWNLVYLGPTTKFVIIGDANTILLTRDLPADLSSGSQLDEYVGRLATEIGRTVFFARQAEYSMTVTGITICGDPELAAALGEVIAEETGLPVDDWRVEELCEWGDTKPDWRLTLSLAAAIAARDKIDFNLLPPEMQPSLLRTMREHTRTAAATLAAAAPVIVLASALWTANVQQDVLAATETKLAFAHQRAQQAALSYQRQQALQDRQLNVDVYGSRNFALAPLLRDVADRTPTRVVLEHLEIVRPEPGKYRLRIHGLSSGSSGEAAQKTFIAFLAALADSPRLEAAVEPEFMEVAGVDESGRHESLTRFTLEYRIRR